MEAKSSVMLGPCIALLGHQKLSLKRRSDNMAGDSEAMLCSCEYRWTLTFCLVLWSAVVSKSCRAEISV